MLFGTIVREMRTLGLALVVVLLWAGGAQARREQTYAYPFSRVWTAAVRMLRVEFESTITEKDKDSGYFLFNFPDGGKSHPGSVEVIAGEGREGVRVVMMLPALPSYVEQMLLDHLARKLGQDYGQPQTPKAAQPQTPNDAAGGSDPNASAPPAQAPAAGAKPEAAREPAKPK